MPNAVVLAGSIFWRRLFSRQCTPLEVIVGEDEAVVEARMVKLINPSYDFRMTYSIVMPAGKR